MTLVCSTCRAPARVTTTYLRSGRIKHTRALCPQCNNCEESRDGQHWRSFAKANDHSAPRAGTGQRLADAIAAAGSISIPCPGRARAGSGLTTWWNLVQQILNGRLGNSPNQAQWLQALQALGLDEPPLPPKVEACAPEVGEILGWRNWLVSMEPRYDLKEQSWQVFTSDGYLSSLPGVELSFAPVLESLTADAIWRPGEQMLGNVEGVSIRNIPTGVYAWKTAVQALEQAEEYKATYAEQYRRYISTGVFPRGALRPFLMVTGSIRLWGTVYEHERGFRASHARVAEITHLHDAPGQPRPSDWPGLEEIWKSLRERYSKP